MVGIPSQAEREFFLRKEVERMKQLREEHEKKLKQEEKKKMKELHYMHCAKCGQKMEVTTIEQVEIEVCPDCGGIYLDSGELWKIMDSKTRGPFQEALSFVRKIWNE